MKKIILFSLVISILSMSSQAQGLYFVGNIGYGVKAVSTIVGSNYNSDGSQDIVKGSFGAGFVPSVSVGYLFNKNIAAELGLGYLLGTKIAFKDYFQVSDNMQYMAINSTNITISSTKFHVNSFYINPSIVLRAGEGKIIPYGKIGVFLGLANKGINEYPNNSKDKFVNRGGVSTGVTASFGSDFMLTTKFAVFGELFGRFANWSPSHFHNSIISGNYTTHVPPPGNYNLNYPVVLPLSAIGLNIGIKYYLAKK